MAIEFKSRADLDKMRAAGRIVHRILQRCTEMCQPGVTTRQIDEEAQRLIDAAGARGLFKYYPTYKPSDRNAFPATLCISVNEEVVHGIAGERVVKDGDIVGIDCGVEYQGWCADSATTVLVGNVPPDVRKLCDVTRHVLDLAIANIRPGRTWSQVARLMQNYAESHGMSVVRDFVGHGIGRKMHEDPKIPNYWSKELSRNDIVLREGLVLAVEPMCNLGGADVITLSDGWTVITADRKPSAHYEHTVAVTADGAEVLTDGR